MKKIAMLFPYAPSYREPIYKLMDKELDVDWYFCGNAARNLKLCDYKLLKNCNLSMEEKKILGRVTYYKGLDNIDFEKYDVLIIAGVLMNLSEWKLIGKYGRKKKGPKVYLWTHGWYGYESALKKKGKKKFFSHADGLLLYGDYARKLLINEGIEEQRMLVIKNSLDYDQQLALRENMTPTDVYAKHFENNNPTIVFIGRLTPIKKLDMIVDAVARLKEKGEVYNITFVGDGSERIGLEKKVENLDLKDNVWFYGECFDEMVNAEMIFNADLCVAPGNIGLTAMHSLMFGCPAISHNDFQWQMPEFESIKPGETGDFFERNNVEDLAHCISNWFATKLNVREEVRQACYKEIDSYWNPYYQLKILKKIL